jgi:broad specificity phosphatase PhoE
MRHGQADFSGPSKWNAPGWSAELAPLTETGEKQVMQQIGKILEFDPEIVLSSPATRALQSALLLHSKLTVPFKVEFDLHEWVPDCNFKWRNLQEVEQLWADFIQYNGEYPEGETRPWETLSHMRSRAVYILHKYINYKRVLVVCHGVLIKSLTNEIHFDTHIDNASLIPFEMKEPSSLLQSEKHKNSGEKWY